MSETKVLTDHGDSPNAISSPPDRWVSCYVASKKRHAPFLTGLRKDWPKIRFSARWPLVAYLPSEESRPARHWQDDNLSDLLGSEVFLIYAEAADKMQNALFEAGIAWAHQKPIYVVGKDADGGDHPDFKNLRGRPRVHMMPNLTRALEAIAMRARYDFRGD